MLDLDAHRLVGQTVEAVESAIASRIADWKQVAGLLKEAARDPQSRPNVDLTLTGSPSRIVQVRPFTIRDAGDENLGLGMLLRDITREKELDEMKSQLLSTVSHELRTPLASIKGFATTLLRQDVQWDEATRREFLSIIDEESDHLSELISNLLDMSRVEAGTLRVEPEPTELLPLIRKTVAEFQVMTREHQFRTALPDSLPMVLADLRRIHQVLRNLLENAVKYSPGGGPILVAVEMLKGEVQIAVSDEGLGIEPQHLQHVFDRFYQADSASTRKVGGAGLGLSICKAIVQAHGGRIWATSQPGAGSTFTFSLPLKEDHRG
jgi:signal transduction histidine kinase